MAFEGKSVDVQRGWHNRIHPVDGAIDHLRNNWQGYLSLFALGFMILMCSSAK